tara:strand:- start:1833 stop:2591 length:759 start_codon:yes stop_codon:yes gene_type:complete
MGKFFNVEINPTIAASLQATQFDSGDLIYDWTAFDVPKGANRLLGVTTVVRGHNGARQEFAHNMYFAKSKTDGTAPTAMGTVNGSLDANIGSYANLLIGQAHIHTNDYIDHHDYLATSSTAFPTTGEGMTTVLQGEPNSGTNVGYDKLYIAGSSSTSSLPDFTTDVYTTGAVAIEQKTVGSLDDGSGSTAGITNKFAVGDVIHNSDDELVGTIASVDSNNAFTTVDDVSVAQVNNDRLFVLSPIKIILHFEI